MLHVTYSEGGKQGTISSQKMGPGYSFTVSPANAGTKHSWVQMTIDTRPRFQSRKRVFSIFFDDQGSVSVGYLAANSTLGFMVCRNVFARSRSVQSSPSRHHLERPPPRQCQSPQNKDGKPVSWGRKRRSCTIPFLPRWFLERQTTARGKCSRVQDLAKAVRHTGRHFPVSSDTCDIESVPK